MTDFKAYVMNADENGKNITGGIETLTKDQLPEGNVLIRTEYSGLNYKDGLVINGNQGRLVRNFPHVPGIDFAGIVEESSDNRYKAGDKVLATGRRIGELYWGGYSQMIRIDADLLVPMPDGLTSRQVMAVGTAGYTAMQCVNRLEEHGLTKDQGEVLVTGAAGGVGSVATTILANLGYETVASTGRASEHDYLKSLGASRIIDRSELSEESERPLESETWAGCVDSVGGTTLSRLLGQMKYGSGVAACGLAGGPALNATVLPFLLRGISLYGIDSVAQNQEQRLHIWGRIKSDLPMESLEKTVNECSLEELAGHSAAILKGEIRGRMVVNLQS